MSKNLLKYFRQSETDCLRAAVFGQAFDEYLNSVHFEGYAEQLKEEQPEMYRLYYLQFVEQSGGNTGGEPVPLPN
jgi:hypothetical protein